MINTSSKILQTLYLGLDTFSDEQTKYQDPKREIDNFSKRVSKKFRKFSLWSYKRIQKWQIRAIFKRNTPI